MNPDDIIFQETKKMDDAAPHPTEDGHEDDMPALDVGVICVDPFTRQL